MKRKQVHKISTRVQIRLPKRKERREAFYCQKYGLKSDNQTLTWTRKYREEPTLPTQDLQGRKSTGRPKTKNLEEQNTYLRMENAILKTLRTLFNP